MAIEFVCNSCGKTLRVPDEHLGKNARCPACQTINLIQPSATSGSNPAPEKSDFSHQPAPPPDYSTPPKTNPYSASPFPLAPSATSVRKPHRGGLVLTLGIISLMCNFFLIPGILAWVFGSSDLKEMKAGIMDREGESLTTVGMVLGIVATVLPLLLFLLYIMFFVFAVVLGLVAG